MIKCVFISVIIVAWLTGGNGLSLHKSVVKIH